MKNINKERLIKIFTDLVKIPSPSWKEHAVIDYIIGHCKKLGVSSKKIKCQNSYNLLIYSKGTINKEPILFSAHTDTVVPCENVKPRVSQTKITGDGTTILGSDDKAAIAMFLEGLYQLRENKIPHGLIEILLTCAEEVGLYGAKGIDYKTIKSKKAFVFDSDGPIGRIVMQAPYHATLNITIKGKASHAGMQPENGINAIYVLSNIIVKIPNGRIDNETTANIGIISGGKATNIVAEEATCKLEIRSIDKNKLKSQVDSIKKVIKETADSYNAKSKILYNLEYAGFKINENDKLSKIVTNSLHNLKLPYTFISSGGGSDTNIFNKNGIKAINLSCGMMNPHTNKEYITIKDLIDGTKLMLEIINQI